MHLVLTVLKANFRKAVDVLVVIRTETVIGPYKTKERKDPTVRNELKS